MEEQLALSAGDAIEIFFLMSIPALLGGVILFAVYLWLRFPRVSVRKKLALIGSQAFLFYLCSFVLSFFDRDGFFSDIIRPMLEAVGLDGFFPFFFAGQILALFISILLLEIFKYRTASKQ